MTAYVVDVENTVSTHHGKKHLDPYEADNSLTMVGMKNVTTGEKLLVAIDHAEYVDHDGINRKAVQDRLDDCTLMIGHNLQHDLAWLWECGYKYDGPIFDTMLGEYLLLRGQEASLRLEDCAIRRNLSHTKDDTLKMYFAKGYSTRDIPLAELSTYLEADLDTTHDLYEAVVADLATPESQSMSKVVDVTMDTCCVLTRLYCNGIKVDMEALMEVKRQFEQELTDIEARLYKQVRQLMGDTPINLNSPEQMSRVVFSRNINNKKEWADLFNHVKDAATFKQTVNKNSSVVYKTEAYICPDCKGQKLVYKTKKDGSPFAKPNKCKACEGEGYKLRPTKEVAGLKFSAPDKTWVTANGFSTGKDVLIVLSGVAAQNNMKEAKAFVDDLLRLNAVSSYLSNFVGGIEAFTKPDGFLHVALTQSVTATGRFSGRNPNMQNMPRGGTFPVKKAFVSRWEGGMIMEADFAQLEFRGAAFLAQDTLAMHEVATGFDVHSYTAKVITDAGESTSRQAAKPHTFAPLYGATGHGRTAAVAAYYHHFIEKYEGIAEWHKKLADEALRFEKITLPSGRQYSFKGVYRRRNGMPSDFTRIKNYPVQGFATADIVPAVLCEFERRLRPYKSLLVNTVHDSIVIDIHPEEIDIVIAIVEGINNDLHKIIMDTYGVDFNVPLLLEAKIGPNWLDTKDVGK